MSLIQFALQTFQETLETELRRYARESQMANLNLSEDPAEHEEAPLVCESPEQEIVTSAAQPSIAERVLAVADAEWKKDIVEPASPAKQNGAARIDQYIRGNLGLGWSTAELGPTARPNIPYTKNGMFQWCGAAVAFFYGNVGLNALARKKHLASTYRLWAWSNGNARRIDVKNIQPGDIVVVGPVGSNYGEHVTICYSVEADRIGTYEGNASGPGPKGDKREGVIKRTRLFRKAGIADREYCVMFAVRPLPEDFV